MRKIFCALGIVLMLAGFAIADLPAPFESAKRIALSGENDGAVYRQTFQDPQDKDTVYVIIYHKSKEAISLVTVDKANSLASALTMVGGRFIYEVVLFTPMGPALLEQKELPESEGLELAFKFFQTLVAARLI